LQRFSDSFKHKEFGYELGTHDQLLGDQWQFPDSANGGSFFLFPEPATRLSFLPDIFPILLLLLLLLLTRQSD
jgi:hypothetical protein